MAALASTHTPAPVLVTAVRSAPVPLSVRRGKSALSPVEVPVRTSVCGPTTPKAMSPGLRQTMALPFETVLESVAPVPAKVKRRSVETEAEPKVLARSRTDPE